MDRILGDIISSITRTDQALPNNTCREVRYVFIRTLGHLEGIHQENGTSRFLEALGGRGMPKVKIHHSEEIAILTFSRKYTRCGLGQNQGQGYVRGMLRNSFAVSCGVW